jgi:hypothetical protein
VIYDSPDDDLPAVPDLLNNGSSNTFPSFDQRGLRPGRRQAVRRSRRGELIFNTTVPRLDQIEQLADAVL